MTADTTEQIGTEVLAFIRERTGLELAPEDDLFATGAVTSLFAMHLVTHVEQTYQVTITGGLLKLDNFRSASAVAELVTTLRQDR
ncbi:phosphopantetheine-binding protein [Streptomyces sp. NPDC005438]|uniref:phosphopantetheine-binding protein n=1 Tax=Streptomyces sp. NPDC005438 TaxID=3156880 RepID=UPI00339E7C10